MDFSRFSDKILFGGCFIKDNWVMGVLANTIIEGMDERKQQRRKPETI